MRWAKGNRGACHAQNLRRRECHEDVMEARPAKDEEAIAKRSLNKSSVGFVLDQPNSFATTAPRTLANAQRKRENLDFARGGMQPCRLRIADHFFSLARRKRRPEILADEAPKSVEPNWAIA